MPSIIIIVYHNLFSLNLCVTPASIFLITLQITAGQSRCQTPVIFIQHNYTRARNTVIFVLNSYLTLTIKTEFRTVWAFCKAMTLQVRIVLVNLDLGALIWVFRSQSSCAPLLAAFQCEPIWMLCQSLPATEADLPSCADRINRHHNSCFTASLEFKQLPHTKGKFLYLYIDVQLLMSRLVVEMHRCIWTGTVLKADIQRKSICQQLCVLCRFLTRHDYEHCVKVHMCYRLPLRLLSRWSTVVTSGFLCHD